MTLAACATPPPTPAIPTATFQHMGTIGFDVARMQARDGRGIPAFDTVVDARLAQTPLDAAMAWARQRFAAAGQTGDGTVVITEARLYEQALAGAEGLGGLFTTPQSERYILRVAARVEADNGRLSGFAESSAERQWTVPEDITLAEREQQWAEMIEAVILDLDQALVRELERRTPLLLSN